MRTPIECVSVCQGYGDILTAVAVHNRPLFDRWVIVTSPDDEETREACKKHSLECVLTEESRRDGAFSKGRMIDRGLSMLRQTGWIMHLDADIALPYDFHPVLADAHLDETCIYGCDRLNVPDYQTWKKIEARGLRARSIPWMVNVSRDGLSVGARVANPGHGWCPLGFMQIFHGSRGLKYPYHHGTAARTDLAMALNWDRRKRVLLPELMVWHLESGPAKMGANWAGRVTPRFGPPLKPFAKPAIPSPEY